ncbi:hypothetical protein CEXT_366041 [Caerostris extrusa]|uniref:Uncharacterized protein n=1 Tax=Caerostris extrusa TaxID=172846 RepID=A0AAV4TG43_CAEEX|nr:hypothetical protein CEXT_366041 [Caerostris extrusa]
MRAKTANPAINMYNENLTINKNILAYQPDFSTLSNQHSGTGYLFWIHLGPRQLSCVSSLLNGGHSFYLVLRPLFLYFVDCCTLLLSTSFSPCGLF